MSPQRQKEQNVSRKMCIIEWPIVSTDKSSKKNTDLEIH